MVKRKALGKGLNALFPEIDTEDYERADSGKNVSRCPVDAIFPNPRQPRRNFDAERIDELAASLKSTGIIQPLIVRESAGGYELIAGERRWRAAMKAGLEEVPIVVKDVPDDQALVLSLIENIQREDLNPVEEAEAYQRLTSNFDLSQERVADIVGKDRSTVANALRLLKLPDRIKDDLLSGRITSGHGRALLGLENNAKMLAMHKEIVSKKLSVRETERLLKKMKNKSASPAAKKDDVELTTIKEKFQYFLGTQIKIVRKGKGGRIEISFFSDEELERIMEIVQGGSQAYGANIRRS